MVVQTTINKKGELQSKLLLSHKQSFNPKETSGPSVNNRVDKTMLTPARFRRAFSQFLYNNRVDKTMLTPARFRRAFSQFLYHISYLRRVKTDEPIYMTEGDFKSAYRQIHLLASTAVKACTCINAFLLVALRMTFGGSPNPSRRWSPFWQMT
jgi:hypothetical protein